MSNVLKGKYGYYYPYKDDTGKDCGLKILDWVYSKYYEPEYLTDQLIDDMLKGKTITFHVDSTNTDVTASIVPYTTKAGVNTRIIKFESDKVDDKKILEANAEKIALSYWTNSGFNYTKPQECINSLSLKYVWKTYATKNTIYGLNNVYIGTIKCYRSRVKNDEGYVIRVKVTRNADRTYTPEYLSEDDYNLIIKNAEAELKTQIEAEAKKEAEEKAIRDEVINWAKDLKDNKIFNGKDTLSFGEMLKNLEDALSTISVPNITDLVTGLLSSSHSPANVNKLFEDFFKRTYRIPRHDKPDNAKEQLLKKLKIYLEYYKIQVVRTDIAKRIKDEGLSNVVEEIDIDTALNLGYFKEVQKLLVKTDPKLAVQRIISNVTPLETNPETLKTNILMFLKIYYDFYDMPEKDRKAIARYIAKNKLSEYYEKIRQFDDVVETLIDESKDPKFLKSILSSIAGTAKANCLKDKTYYFERRAKLRKEFKLHKPIELLEKLKDCIKDFNVTSNVAILTNIELDTDESFIFQFYTFSNDSGEDFDGRRVQYMTKIYNAKNPSQRIGFCFDNSDDDSSDE